MAPVSDVLPRAKWPSPAQRGQRKVDSIGNVSFAGTTYNVGRLWAGRLVDVFTAYCTFYIVSGRSVVTHRAKHPAFVRVWHAGLAAETAERAAPCEASALEDCSGTLGD